MTEPNEKKQHDAKMTDRKEQPLGRRSFLKTLGGGIFAFTILSVAKSAMGSTCCGYCDGEPDCDAPGEWDGTCGWLGDNDGGCGNGQKDNNCGAPNDPDDNCSPPCSDSHDVDGSCGQQGEPDYSCGDCDDSHDTDDACGINGDPDDLCGHPHYMGLDEDNNCTSTSESDAFCGTYTLAYIVGGSATDTDQSCNVGVPSNDGTYFDRNHGCDDRNAPEWHYSGQ
jgi:hypothetical protein